MAAEPGTLLTGRALEFARSRPKQQELTGAGINDVPADSPRVSGAAVRAFARGL